MENVEDSFFKSPPWKETYVFKIFAGGFRFIVIDADSGRCVVSYDGLGADFSLDQIKMESRWCAEVLDKLRGLKCVIVFKIFFAGVLCGEAVYDDGEKFLRMMPKLIP